MAYPMIIRCSNDPFLNVFPTLRGWAGIGIPASPRRIVVCAFAFSAAVPELAQTTSDIKQGFKQELIMK
jgi:hypothetical protein